MDFDQQEYVLWILTNMNKVQCWVGIRSSAAFLPSTSHQTLFILVKIYRTKSYEALDLIPTQHQNLFILVKQSLDPIHVGQNPQDVFLSCTRLIPSSTRPYSYLSKFIGLIPIQHQTLFILVKKSLDPILVGKNPQDLFLSSIVQILNQHQTVFLLNTIVLIPIFHQTKVCAPVSISRPQWPLQAP